MWEQVPSALARALGLGVEAKDLAVWQMSLRAAALFIAAVAIMRLGDKRFLGRYASLDILLGVVYGSVVSRAITGNAPFLPAIGACLTLVALHWLLSALAFRIPGFGRLLKGRKALLIADGDIQWAQMRRWNISEEDLAEALRQHSRSPRVGDVRLAYLERDGAISLTLRER